MDEHEQYQSVNGPAIETFYCLKGMLPTGMGQCSENIRGVNLCCSSGERK